jgi:DNA-3-methyladenine glycosylase II
MNWTATYYPLPPYNFALTAYASRYYSTLGVLRAEAYQRVLRVNGIPALIEVSGAGTVDAPILHARLLTSGGPVDAAALEVAVVRLLNLNADQAPFYAFARAHPGVWRTVEPLYGLHTFQHDSLFESLAITIIEQQIALRMAQQGERWLIATYGESLDYQGERYYAFPTPQRLAALTVDDLKPLKITFRRMQTVIDVARREVDGETRLEALRERPAGEVYHALVRMKGVGHWTAAWAITRALGEYPYVGRADVALRAAVNAYYFGENGRADADVMDALFKEFGRFAGVIGFYTLMRWAFDRYAVWE